MPNQYEIPFFGSPGSDLLGWLLEAVEEGNAWLSAQEPTREWDKILDLLGTGNPDDELEGLSNTGYNLVERNAKDLVASLSNFRYDGEFKPRFDQRLYDQGHVLTKLDRNWYVEMHAHEAVRANLQHAVVFGTGYLYETWVKDAHGTYGDIGLEAYDPKDVTFLQLPRSHDLQQAYAVILHDEIPLNLARRMFPGVASLLRADHDQPGWIAKGLQKIQRLMGGSPALRVAGTQRPSRGSFPTIDVYRMYTLDSRINESSSPVTMGTHGTNWSYSVPALGDPIPTGIRNPATGQEWTRPAEPEDCRLFPLRRYSIFTRTAMIYDGSSPWWHGQVPLARLRFNDWAWQALGKSILSAPRTMQDGIIRLMRAIEDSQVCRLDPPILADDQQASETFTAAFSLRRAGARARVNLQAGEIFKPAVPYQHYDVPPGSYEYLQQQETRINNQMGTPDLVAIAKARQVPSEGTLEKVLEMAGPLVQDMFRAFEVPFHDLGEWRKAYYFQFYTRPRILTLTGPNGETEDYQFAPTQLVPDREGETLAQRQDRTKLYVSEFKYVLTESGINEMHRLINRLALLQLQKAGLPIDWWTIAKAWRIPNFGPEPEGTKDVVERWIAQQHLTRELAEEMGAGPAGAGPGRPHTNQKPPQLRQKDHGTRSTVTTS